MLDIVGRNPTMRAIGLKFFSGDTLVETADDGLDRARAGPRTLRVHSADHLDLWCERDHAGSFARRVDRGPLDSCTFFVGQPASTSLDSRVNPRLMTAAPHILSDISMSQTVIDSVESADVVACVTKSNDRIHVGTEGFVAH